MRLSNALVSAFVFAVLLAVNVLANALPINGRTTAAISDSFPLIFVPAGYTFAIWGVIYLALSALVIHAALPAGRRSLRLAALGPWLPLNFSANALWILAWHYGAYAVSLALMLTILVSLKAMHARLDAVDRTASSSRLDFWMVRAPLSVYWGWISVAVIPNAAVTLLAAGWDGAPFAPVVWAAALVVVAAALNLAVVLRRRDLLFGAVGVWALAGIAARQQTALPEFAALCVAAATIIGLAIAVSVANRMRPALPRPTV